MGLQKIGLSTNKQSTTTTLYPTLNLPDKVSSGSRLSCDGDEISIVWKDYLPLGTWSSGTRLNIRTMDADSMGITDSGSVANGEDGYMNPGETVNGKVYFNRGKHRHEGNWDSTGAFMGANRRRLRLSSGDWDTAGQKGVDGHCHDGKTVGIIKYNDRESSDRHGNAHVIMSKNGNPAGGRHSLHDVGSGERWKWGTMFAVTNGETTISWYIEGDRGGKSEAIAVEHGTKNIKWREAGDEYTQLRPTANHYVVLTDDKFIARRDGKWKCVEFDTGNIIWSVNPSVSTGKQIKPDKDEGYFYYKKSGKLVCRSSSDGSKQGEFDDVAGIGSFCAGNKYIYYYRSQKPKTELNRIKRAAFE